MVFNSFFKLLRTKDKKLRISRWIYFTIVCVVEITALIISITGFILFFNNQTTSPDQSPSMLWQVSAIMLGIGTLIFFLAPFFFWLYWINFLNDEAIADRPVIFERHLDEKIEAIKNHHKERTENLEDAIIIKKEKIAILEAGIAKNKTLFDKNNKSKNHHLNHLNKTSQDKIKRLNCQIDCLEKAIKKEQDWFTKKIANQEKANDKLRQKKKDKYRDYLSSAKSAQAEIKINEAVDVAKDKALAEKNKKLVKLDKQVEKTAAAAAK